MGRMKLGIAVAGAVVVLLGVVAMVTMRSDGGTDRATTVASQASDASTVPAVTTGAPQVAVTQPAAQPTATTKAPNAPVTTAAPAKAPAAAATPASIPRSPQDVQQFIAGITAQLQATAAANGNTTPMTKEQVEAQVRAQLQQLGITL